MSIKDTYASLMKVVADAGEDVEKLAKGNKAARTRLRKSMQEVKGVAQQLRVEALGDGTAESAGSSSPSA